MNQLLAKIDGVEQLNNILVIGMTNRKDMIDEALMRPGRLEVSWDKIIQFLLYLIYTINHGFFMSNQFVRISFPKILVKCM